MRILKSKRESTQGNQYKCTTFRISQFAQSNSYTHLSPIIKTPFLQRKNKLLEFNSKTTIKISTKRTLAQSTRNFRDRSTAVLSLSKLVKMQSSDFAQTIAMQIQRSKRFGSEKREGSQKLALIFDLCQKINQEVYSYKTIESDLAILHNLIKILGSSTFIYRAFAFSGFCLFEYGSYSLSLYYFDRALKSFYDRDGASFYTFQRKLQLQLYKYVSRIFLVKGRYCEAKKFAYKYLRKSWILQDEDEEMSAFDLLGKLYMQSQNMSMCRYFHYRMTSGEKQSSDILSMSKQEMGKQSRQKMQFVCYQTINIFVDKDSLFNDILENHYRMRSLQHSQDIGAIDNEAKQIYIYTHHSPNRLLSNYHLLERKMIQARNSKELHFIRPKDCHRLRKLFSDFSATVHEIRQKYDSTCFPTQFTIKDQIEQEKQVGI